MVTRDSNDEESIQRLSHAMDEAKDAINNYIDRTKKELGIDEFQSELLRYEFLNLE